MLIVYNILEDFKHGQRLCRVWGENLNVAFNLKSWYLKRVPGMRLLHHTYWYDKNGILHSLIRSSFYYSHLLAKVKHRVTFNSVKLGVPTPTEHSLKIIKCQKWAKTLPNREFLRDFYLRISPLDLSAWNQLSMEFPGSIVLHNRTHNLQLENAQEASGFRGLEVHTSMFVVSGSELTVCFHLNFQSCQQLPER